MKGIITRTLEVKKVYDNMDETMRPIFFRTFDKGEWYIKGENDTEFEIDIHNGWYVLYGLDEYASCELVFTEDKNGKYIPVEYSVYDIWKNRTYFRKFREF